MGEDRHELIVRPGDGLPPIPEAIASHAIDLSDEGIREDLERHGRDAGDL